MPAASTPEGESTTPENSLETSLRQAQADSSLGVWFREQRSDRLPERRIHTSWEGRQADLTIQASSGIMMP
jgi:hypothetical protein